MVAAVKRLHKAFVRFEVRAYAPAKLVVEGDHVLYFPTGRICDTGCIGKYCVRELSDPRVLTRMVLTASQTTGVGRAIHAVDAVAR
jgi:hypothetical protein